MILQSLVKLLESIKDLDLTPDQNRALEHAVGDFLSKELGKDLDVEVTHVQDEGDCMKLFYAYEDPKTNKERTGSMYFTARILDHSVEDFAEKKFAKEDLTEKVHTLRNPDIKKKGAPEDKARAFDKVHGGTGKRPDRSVLKTNNREYHSVEGGNEGDYMQVLVMGGDVPDIDHHRKYHGINVLFMADGSIEKSIADDIAKGQWRKDKEKIIAAARKHWKAGTIEAFVKRGGDADKRGPDDYDNGHNPYSANGPHEARKGDYHGYHDKKTNEEESKPGWFVVSPGGRALAGPFPTEQAAKQKIRDGSVEDDIKPTAKYGVEDGWNFKPMKQEALTFKQYLLTEGNNGPFEAVCMGSEMRDDEKWLKFMVNGTTVHLPADRCPGVKKGMHGMMGFKKDGKANAGKGGWYFDADEKQMDEAKKSLYGAKLGGVSSEKPSFGFEDRLNAQKTKSALDDAGIKYKRHENFGIFYFDFESEADMKKAVKLAKAVIDKSEESEW